LLRSIQEKTIRRVGGNKDVSIDVRILAATNRDLTLEVKEGRFRQDLFYRLNVIMIDVPPLADRADDIPSLAEYFLEKYCALYQKKIKRLSSPAIDLLMQYHWPGNVRELENAIERAVLICDEEVIRSYHLPPSLQTAQSSDTRARMTLPEAVEKVERELIVEALKETRGNQSRAAKLLGVTLRILNYKIKKYGLNPRSFRPPREKRA